MPKLNAATAKKAKKAADEGGGPRKVIPRGVYQLRLKKVTSGTSAAGNAQWVWDFITVKPAEHKGNEVREWTDLGEDSLWKLGQIFNAFDEDADTDTDELVGETCMAELDVQIQQKGKGKGKERNYITQFLDSAEKPRLFEVEDTNPADRGETDEDAEEPADEAPF